MPPARHGWAFRRIFPAALWHLKRFGIVYGISAFNSCSASDLIDSQEN